MRIRDPSCPSQGQVLPVPAKDRFPALSKVISLSVLANVTSPPAKDKVWSLTVLQGQSLPVLPVVKLRPRPRSVLANVRSPLVPAKIRSLHKVRLYSILAKFSSLSTLPKDMYCLVLAKVRFLLIQAQVKFLSVWLKALFLFRPCQVPFCRTH